MNYLFRAVDVNNDWAFGNGVQSYLTGNAAIQADIKTALLVFLGECFFALQAGVDWINLVGGKNPAAQTGIILQCRAVILNVNGVVSVNSVSPSLVGRNLSVTYSVNTVFSQTVTGSVQPGSASAP
jgi:hypothetical protein